MTQKCQFSRCGRKVFLNSNIHWLVKSSFVHLESQPRLNNIMWMEQRLRKERKEHFSHRTWCNKKGKRDLRRKTFFLLLQTFIRTSTLPRELVNDKREQTVKGATLWRETLEYRIHKYEIFSTLAWWWNWCYIVFQTCEDKRLENPPGRRSTQYKAKTYGESEAVFLFFFFFFFLFVTW